MLFLLTHSTDTPIQVQGAGGNGDMVNDQFDAPQRPANIRLLSNCRVVYQRMPPTPDHVESEDEGINPVPPEEQPPGNTEREEGVPQQERGRGDGGGMH